MSSHHTGVFHARGSHRRHDDHQHINNILHRAAVEAKEAGYENVHASIITDGVHQVLHHGHHASDERGEQHPA